MSKLTFIRPGVLALVFACSAGAGRAQATRPFTPADFMGIRWITSAQISPDATQVAYTIAAADAAHNRQLQSIWLVSTHGGAPRKLIGELSYPPPDARAPQWSPDGRFIAFTSGREGINRIWLINPAGGEAAQLTSAKWDVQDFAWSPTGARIAFVAAAANAAPPSEPRVVGQAGGSGPQLYLVDAKTKEITQLTKGELNAADFAWSPDGQQIAFSARSDLYVVNVGDAQVRKLVERPGQDRLPRFSPDGKLIAFFTNFGQPGYKRGLSFVAAAGGAPQDSLQSWDAGFGGYPPWFFDWAADSKTILSAGLARMKQNLHAISIETGAARAVTTGASVYHDFSLARDRRTLACLASDSATPTEVYVSSVDEFKPRRLTTTNPQLDGIAFGQTEAVQWRSKDGLAVEGLLLKPVGYREGQRYPLVVLMEGTFGSFDFSFTGRVSADSTAGFMFPFQPQLLAARGYAVLMPNPRGSWGYGVEFGTKALGDFGIGPYNDIVAGVDALVAQGIADGERLAVMGIFVDAYRAAFAMTQTNRFKAAVLAFPIFDLVSWYGQAGPDATYLDRYFGGAPWQVPQAYTPINPVNFADRIKTPTLLLSMEQSDLPLLQQAQEMYTALRRNNVAAEYLVYPKQDFGFNHPRATADVLRRQLEWCDRWLKQAAR
ncbi:MAG: S9 family peptidase [Pyrinomonadaceae bacterium]